MIVEVDSQLREALPLYIRGRQEDLGHIERALEKGDYEAIRKIGRRVASNAAGYGLPMLAEISKEIENSASDRSYDDCKTQIDRLRNFLVGFRPKFV